MREGAVDDAHFWLDVVEAVGILGFLTLVAIVHRSRRRLALQTNRPPEHVWIWISLILLCWEGIFVTGALSDVFDSLWPLWLALMIVFGTSSVIVLHLLFFVIKPWEGSTRQGPVPGAHRDDQGQ
jgi:hypothetical protein